MPERATGPYTRFEDVARRVRQASIDALIERCRALLSPDERAEAHYAAALRSHEHDSRPFEHARTMLLYGEWLRRARAKPRPASTCAPHWRSSITSTPGPGPNVPASNSTPPVWPSHADGPKVFSPSSRRSPDWPPRA
ncbi:hypothetical protein [Nonomuraea jabiensis]|uniref:Uncharacterized protein n=1 Tax=Nonomuraea jabiensis TaxID=882448 RepID=A0A7W9GGJ0_9ACTN|nr:hypothetical protein [Nonomuraea jabiensis]MBB5783171.1 hypothetical protein [Nonomuraea jabiensis]